MCLNFKHQVLLLFRNIQKGYFLFPLPEIFARTNISDSDDWRPCSPRKSQGCTLVLLLLACSYRRHAGRAKSIKPLGQAALVEFSKELYFYCSFFTKQKFIQGICICLIWRSRLVNHFTFLFASKSLSCNRKLSILLFIWLPWGVVIKVGVSTRIIWEFLLILLCGMIKQVI